MRSRGELTATEKTGVASTSNLSTMGVSVPTGSRERIELTLSRTSWAARSRLRSRKNWAVIDETPSRLEELNSSMPSTVLMISSMGCVTPVSISSGEAPRKVVLTVMIGSSTLGICSTPNSRNANQPTTTNKTLSIVAKTGRRMHTSASPTPVVDSWDWDGALASGPFISGPPQPCHRPTCHGRW